MPPAPFPLPLGVGEAAAVPGDDAEVAADESEDLLDAGTDDPVYFQAQPSFKPFLGIFSYLVMKN